jgi:hypothetical protein
MLTGLKIDKKITTRVPLSFPSYHIVLSKNGLLLNPPHEDFYLFRNVGFPDPTIGFTIIMPCNMLIYIYNKEGFILIPLPADNVLLTAKTYLIHFAG